MGLNPSYAITPRIGVGQVTVANAGRDGTGTLVDILVGASTGTKIAEVVVQSTVTTTAGMVRLFTWDGTTNRLFYEFLVSAITVSGSVQAFRSSVPFDNLVLPSASWTLRAATNNAEAMNVIALGADL